MKADRDESSPYAAMLAAQDVAVRLKELGARLPKSMSLTYEPASAPLHICHSLNPAPYLKTPHLSQSQRVG